MRYCEITVEEVNFDRRLPGYMTVNVEGRGMAMRKIHEYEVEGREGGAVFMGGYPSLDLTVYFELQARDNPTFLKRLRQLTSEINRHQGLVRFRFGDEEGTRRGVFKSFENPPYDRNHGIGHFVIHCPDPFVMGPERKSRGKVVSRFPYSVKMDELLVVVKTKTAKLILKNERSGKKIVLNGDFKTGDRVRITDAVSIKKASASVWQDFMLGLDPVESDFFAFELWNEDRVSVSNADVTLRYRERWLG